MRSNTHNLDQDPQPIVITGAGLAASLGVSRAEVWSAIRAGRDGSAPLRSVESDLPSTARGGEVPPLPAGQTPDVQREVAYLRHVIRAAITESGIDTSRVYTPRRCGVILGTTLHGMRSGGAFLRTDDFTHLKGFLAGAVLRAALVDHDKLFDGPKLTTCSACSSGLAAISLACTLLRAGELDCVLAGGYDAISEYSFAGFNSMRLVSTDRIRPFARQRDGMQVAEGYGVVVLERADAAHRRNARVLGRITGIGESCDSYHLSKPHPEGAGAASAMQLALSRSAGPDCAIDLIVAHATATPDNDAAEFAALHRFLGAQLPKVPVVAFKSYIGHSLGGAGAVELILSLSAMADGVIPPTLHVGAEDIAFDGLTLQTGAERRAPLRRVLCTSLGFGGANVALAVESAEGAGSGARAAGGGAGGGGNAPSQSDLCQQSVCITGIGALLPASLIPQLRSASCESRCVPHGPFLVDENQLELLLKAQRTRRMSRYAKLSLAAASRALADAGLPAVDPFDSSGGAILATTHGSAEFCHSLYTQIVKEGISAANPLLFSEGVPNVGAAHVSTAFGIRGFCQTFIGTRTAGLDALHLAAARIRTGEWSRALVVAAEEHHPLVEEAYQFHGALRQKIREKSDRIDFVMGDGGVAFILESETFARQRGAKVWGQIVPAAPDDCAVEQSAIKRMATSEVVCVGGRTWWGRAERANARKLLFNLHGTRKKMRMRSQISSFPDDWPELSSVGPLVALAQWLRPDQAVLSGADQPRRAICLAYDMTGVMQSVHVATGDA